MIDNDEVIIARPGSVITVNERSLSDRSDRGVMAVPGSSIKAAPMSNKAFRRLLAIMEFSESDRRAK